MVNAAQPKPTTKKPIPTTVKSTTTPPPKKELTVDTIPDNLILYYPFDTNCISGSNGVSTFKVANVASGRRVYDATMSGGEIETMEKDYKIGDGSAAFNGKSFITVQPNFVDVSGGITISFFFNIPSDQRDGSGNIIFNNKNSYFFIMNGMISMDCSGNLNVGNSVITINNFDNYRNGKWHHFAWVLSKYKIWFVFIDGAVVVYETVTAPYPIFGINNKNNLYIGQGMYGFIDDFRVYSVPLYPNDIVQLQTVTNSFTFTTISTEPPTLYDSIIAQQMKYEKTIAYNNLFIESFTPIFRKNEKKIRIINLSVGILISIGYFYFLVK